MTDNEIIKALECCTNEDRADCEQCPLDDLNRNDCFSLILHKHSLGLINRQKAEIERLQTHNTEYARKHYQDGKAEAIEDVLLTLEAEAVSSDKYIREYDDSEVQKAYNQALWKAYNLVKEMVGE